MLTLLKQGGWGNCNQLFPPSLGRVVGVIAQRNGPPGVSDGLLCASRRHWGTAQCFQGRNSGRNSLPGETSLLASAASRWVYLEKAEPASSQQRTAMRWEAVDTSCRKGDTQIYFFHQQERSGRTREQGPKEVVKCLSSEIFKPWLDTAPSNQLWAGTVICSGLDWRPHSFTTIVENNSSRVTIQVKFCSKQEWQQDPSPSSKFPLWRNSINFFLERPG